MADSRGQPHHPILPNHHFSAPCAESLSCLRAGHFYATISLTQAIAESISKFIAQRNGLRPVGIFERRVSSLRESGLISVGTEDAFKHIWAERNDYHHLNPSVETDRLKLEAKASQCSSDLTDIQKELFAFDVDAGAVRPRHPQYWDATETGAPFLSVYLQIEY